MPKRPANGVTLGQVGLDGKFRREMMIGGQGIGMNVYSKKIPETIKFLEWFYQPEQQKRWAAVCQTGLTSIIESPDWQKLNAYNKSFAHAMTHMPRLLASSRISAASRHPPG